MFQFQLPLTLSTRITTHERKEGWEEAVYMSEGKREKEEELTGCAGGGVGK